MSFWHDISTDLHLQTIADAFRKSVQTAAQAAEAIPDVAANITGIIQKYPHMTPGVTYALGSAGYGPDDSITDSAAQLAAQRKIDDNIGWNSVGDRVNPTHMGLLNIPGMRFPELVANTIEGAAHLVDRGLQDFGDAAQSVTGDVLRTTAVAGQSGGQLIGAAVRNIAGGTASSNSLTDELKQTTAYQAITRKLSGQGFGVGSGYIPKGPAVDAAQAQTAAQSLRDGTTLTYADHPFFSLNGESTPSQHVGTPGRLLFARTPLKYIITPGSDMFSALSGIVDAALMVKGDPTAAILDKVGEARQGASTFTPEDLGPSHPESAIPTGVGSSNTPFTEANETLSPDYVPPSPTVTPQSIRPSDYDVGLVNGTRPTILPAQTAPWLNIDPQGVKVVNDLADNSNSYDIFMRMGGMKGNITPELSGQLAAASTPDDVRDVLNNQLGLTTGLLEKPDTTLGQVGGIQDAIGIRDRIDSIRMLQKMPAQVSINLEDSKDVAQQLILHARNAKAPQDLLEQHFANLAAATNGGERGQVLDNFFLDLAHHITTTDLGGITGTENNFARLAGAWKDNNDALLQIARDQIALKAPINGVYVDGGTVLPLSSPYLDQEAYDPGGNLRFYDPPDIRRIRQMSSTYGRLLAMSKADVPLNALTHIQDQWRALNIAKIATTLRIIGEGQINMAARGMWDNPGQMISALAGKALTEDHLGDPLSYRNAINKFRDNVTGDMAPGNWQNDLVSRGQQVVHNTDPEFTKALANDIIELNRDDVSRRLAGGFGDNEATTGNNITDTQNWLRSDDPAAAAYRSRFGLTDDSIAPFVINRANDLQALTATQPTLMSAVRSGEWQPGSLTHTIDDQGNLTIQTGFQNHINSLVDQGLTIGATKGNIIDPLGPTSNHLKILSDWAFDHLLRGPNDKYVLDLAYRNQYFANLAKTLPHAAEDVQQAMIDSAAEQGLNKDGVQALRDIAARRSGNLTSEEAILLNQAHTANDIKDMFYDAYDRRQGLDALRLIAPYGNSWAQSLKQAANLLMDHPEVIPRASMFVNGAINSGFFFKDPKTGAETLAIPGGEFANKLMTGLPFQLTAPVNSLASYGSSALLPGFGPMAQIAADKIIPDKPAFDGIRNAISPFKAPDSVRSFVPSWLNKIAGGLGSPQDTQTWASTYGDVLKYNASTGHYNLNTVQGQQKLEDDSLKMAKRLYIFKGLAQFTLPISPTTQDVAEDKSGHAVLSLQMTKDYHDLVKQDIQNHTNLATQSFIDKYGMKNILGMQSMTQGQQPLNTDGYNWARNNPDIMRTYPDIYSMFAPNTGGWSQQAYDAMFKDGQRKVLTPQEAIDAANTRVANMIYYNAKDAIGPKADQAQRQWLAGVKERLLQQYPGWNPDFVGTKIPGEIRQLEAAANDPRLANNPVTPAIQAYLTARDQAAKASGIQGWASSNSTVATRQWLRNIAAAIITKVPEFRYVYDSLLSHELKDDTTGAK